MLNEGTAEVRLVFILLEREKYGLIRTFFHEKCWNKELLGFYSIVNAKKKYNCSCNLLKC